MYRKSYMKQIYLLEGVCKKLCVKVIFRSYNFPKKRHWGEKIFSKNGNIPAVQNRSLGALPGRAD